MFFAGTILDGMFLIIALLVRSLNCDKSSLADLLALDMKNNVSILSFLVDSLTSWCSENSSALSMTCRDMVGILQPCLRECDSRRMYLILKSPSTETVMSFWMCILDKESRALSRYIVSLLSE